ncbi:ec2b7a5c-c5af-40a9-b1bb-4dcb3bb53178 [Thermothielavioides terrestris]|uniref:Ec2b7a5c-c5af-40a9-b1bb-4dcb3bb53178 n=1 Tax=Thermothielavioides terrestris TaxID=2587410 RepID=A0A446BMW5_9PEZI|nr:ec2b7a5c-c5af-40a9-b1bb-4dcb3bb53178 [Thermothielavioides terrestris]
MPRQLPWKVGSASAKQAPSSPRPKAAQPSASPAPSASRSPAPSHRPTPTPQAASTPDPSRKPRRSLALSSARSPSTSPPPEPIQEEFMIEGVDHDDRYRMVEDEFLAVAGEFTRHLHAAEYQRLKNLAKSQNAETIRHISRPVTGEMSDLVKRRHAALDTASRQRRGIAKTLGKRAAGDSSLDGDEQEPTRRPFTSLQGLMESPRKQAVPLTSVMGPRPGASFRDEADGSPSRRRGLARHGSMDMFGLKKEASPVRLKREPSQDSDDDDLDANGDDDHDDDFFSRLRARRAEQKRRREARTGDGSVKISESQAAALNEIPFI